MAVSISMSLKFLSLTLLYFATSCCRLAYGQQNPVAAASRAFYCFNNKFYKRCGEEYRLDQSGYVNIPSYATDDYCHGPCLRETQSLLNCIDDMFSSFFFLNRATVPDVRNALRAGCSYTTQRGIFNVGDYIGREINDSNKLQSSVSFIVLMLAILVCWFLLK
ncbi:hypothetical protein QQ045_022638 [Rhodiola kirilowii]